MLYIVRHGQTNWNIEKRITGRMDISINETGIKEAYELKEKLKDIKFDYIFTSPLKRTIETAKIIRDQEIIIDERLIERGNGKFEGMKKDEINFDFNKLNDNSYNVESISSLRDRTESFFKEIKDKYRGKNILIVTHGGVCIQVRYFFEGKPKSGNYEEYIINNCEVLKYNND